MRIDPNLLIAAKLIHDECVKNLSCTNCQLRGICVWGKTPNDWEIPDPPQEGLEMKYECKETFSFENCCFGADDAAEEYMTVVAGSIWDKTDDNFIGGDIHLDSEDGLSWIEISRYELKKYFEEEGEEKDEQEK